MPGFKDRIGDQYGRLTVISHAGKDHPITPVKLS